VLTTVPFTVPVPSALKTRIPSTELDEEKAVALTSGWKLALKPEFGRAVPGVGLPGPGSEPGANRQEAVPVKAYSPLSFFGEAASAPPP
jgi:hypothetical protein